MQNMPCLRLKLPLRPARKAWKSFASKLHTKLHKFQSSKAIKKTKHCHLAVKRKKPSRALRFGFRLQKAAAAPVYVDKLFTESGGTSKEGGTKQIEKSCGNHHDHVWESLVLASPQMRGIDQRAEEFIARFRAEMEYQEILLQSHSR